MIEPRYASEEVDERSHKQWGRDLARGRGCGRAESSFGPGEWLVSFYVGLRGATGWASTSIAAEAISLSRWTVVPGGSRCARFVFSLSSPFSWS